MKREIEKILNSTHDGIIAIDKDGIITLFNKAAEKLIQYPADKAVGDHIENVILNTKLPLILNTGVSDLNQRQPLNETTIITNRMPMLDDDGNIIGAVAVFRDISEVIDLAEEITDLKEIQSTLQATFNSTQDAISVVDQNGIGVLINPAYTRITGYTEKDIIGKLCTVDLAEGESIHLKVLKTREPVTGVKLKVGVNRREVICEAAPIIVNGELRGSVAVIHDLTEINNLIHELDQAKKIIRNLEAKYTFDDIIGVSPVMQDVIDKSKLAAATPATVILRGESGTGKELFAHAIHNLSNRKYAQFIRVNCAAISENLLESELFGYEEGAFTGASKGGRIGYFEQANGGTIFLDEIGEINLNTQAKLLRVLQEKEIVRVGSTKPIPIDVRVISATNLDLEKAIKNGEFRQDLYYRLNVVPIKLPSLRDRKEDMPLLIQFLLNKFNQEYGRSVEGISQTALSIIMDYHWPGNIRELENVIGRALINMKISETTIMSKHIPKIHDNVDLGKEVFLGKEYLEVNRNLNLDKWIEHAEKEHIEFVLDQNKGNREKTAMDLGISIRNLYYKIKKHGINY